jgi:hypothetical protein
MNARYKKRRSGVDFLLRDYAMKTGGVRSADGKGKIKKEKSKKENGTRNKEKSTLRRRIDRLNRVRQRNNSPSRIDSFAEGLDLGKDIRKFFREISNVKNLIDDLKNSFSKLISPIVKQIDEIKRFLNEIKGFFICIEKVFKSIISYIACGAKLVVNMPSCLLYYLLDFFKYVFIDLPVFVLCWLIPDLKPLFRAAGKTFQQFDNDMYPYLGFRFTQYSESVQRRCYTCKIEPMPKFKSMGNCADDKTSDKKIIHPIVYKECKKK